jgi:hypothetical protein
VAKELLCRLNQGELEPRWNQVFRSPCYDVTDAHILINSPALGQSTSTYRDLSPHDGVETARPTPGKDRRGSGCVGASMEPIMATHP